MALAMVQEIPAPPELLPDEEAPELLELLPDEDDPKPPGAGLPDDGDPELLGPLPDDDPASSEPGSLLPLELEHPTPTRTPRPTARNRDVMGSAAVAAFVTDHNISAPTHGRENDTSASSAQPRGSGCRSFARRATGGAGHWVAR